MHIGSRRLSLTLSASAFFISGFAALTYQIVWQRLLVLPIGADVYSTTIIVAAFMAGLGVGSLVGGQVADRLSTLQCVLLFIGAELAVAAFGIASRWVFYDWMYLRLGPASMPSALTSVILFFSLLWPTFWMGISLPVLSRAVTSGLAGAARRVGLLYGFNTLGAAAGAFVTTWLLFPRLGLEGSVQLAAGLNVLAVVAVLPIARSADRGEIDSADAGNDEARVAAVTATDASGRERWPLLAWIALYGIAGFQALSLEIIWFRVLGVAMKSSAFTFGTLLTIYLTGLGIGAAAGSLLLRRVHSPGRAFLVLQAFVGLYAGASIAALVTLLPSSTLMPELWSYFGGYEPLDAVSAFGRLRAGESDATVTQFIRLYILLPVVLVIPPTLAMGASFPLLQKVALVDPHLIGRRVAQVLLANIAGSTVGSILTGWLALSYLGSAGSLKLMMVLGGIYLALAALSTRGRSRSFAAVVAVAILAIVGAAAAQLPSGRQLWAALHGTPPQRVVVAEDATGLSLIKAAGSGAIVFVDGIGQSWIPYGNVHTALGALPAFLHPHPRSAALIGLGSGDTLYAIAGRQELSRVVSIEIIRPQLATLQDWARRTGEPALLALLGDRRIEHVSGDGRVFVMRSGQQFDIIEADALRPGSAYSGNLYSVGYFQLLRSRLAPGGFAVTWAPTSRVHDTFRAVFPEVLSFGDILVGSDTPIPFDADQVRARLRTPEVQAYYRRAGVDIESLLAQYLAAPVSQGTSGTTPSPDDLNEDLFPRDEFSSPRAVVQPVPPRRGG